MAPDQLKFRYDLNTFINAVKERRCIWDKRDEDHKCRSKKLFAWEEILSILEPTFHDMNNHTKEKYVNMLLTKWANLRDAFVRSLKNVSSLTPHLGYPTKPYVYYEQMKFLLADGHYDYTHVRTRNENSDSRETDADYGSESNPEPILSLDDLPSLSPLVRVEQEEFEDDARKSKRKTHQKRRPCLCQKTEYFQDEDMSFFYSILRPVSTLGMSEKLEFRIGVLTLLQSLKNIRSGSNSPTRKRRKDSDDSFDYTSVLVKEEEDIIDSEAPET